MTALWVGFRNKVPDLLRHIYEVLPFDARAQNDRLRRRHNEAGVYAHIGQLEVDFLAKGIALLARQIEDQKHQSSVAVEEASLALHFRKTKQQVHAALVLLERQGAAKRIGLEGPWILQI